MKQLLLRLSFIVLTLSEFSSYAAKITVAEPDTAATEKQSITSIKDALKEFSSLSHHDKKMRFKEMKKV